MGMLARSFDRGVPGGEGERASDLACMYTQIVHVLARQATAGWTKAAGVPGRASWSERGGGCSLFDLSDSLPTFWIGMDHRNWLTKKFKGHPDIS